MRLFSPDGSVDLSVSDVVEKYLAWLKGRVDADDYDAKSLGDVTRDLRHFAVFRAGSARDCHQHDLTAFLAANPQWKSAATKKRVLAEIVGCFNWACGEELIDRRPYHAVRSISKLPYKPRRPAIHAEYVTLMRFSSRPLRRALFMLRRTGIRPSEMRGLRWQECHLDGDSPHLLIERHKNRRRTGKARMVGLDAATAIFLRALRRRCTGEYVFHNCDGQPWGKDSFAQHLRRWADRLGLGEGVEQRVSAYCLRHTYAVDGIEAGETDRKIADQLGHVGTDMVGRVYGSHTRHKQDHLANVADAITRRGKRKK